MKPYYSCLGAFHVTDDPQAEERRPEAETESASVEISLDRHIKPVTTERRMTGFSSLEVSYLKASGKLEKLSHNFPEMHLAVKNGSLIISGPEQDLGHCESAIYSEVSSILKNCKVKTIQLPKEAWRFLQTKEGRDQLYLEQRKSTVGFGWKQCAPVVQIIALDDDDLQLASTLIELKKKPLLPSNQSEKLPLTSSDTTLKSTHSTSVYELPVETRQMTWIKRFGKQGLSELTRDVKFNFQCNNISSTVQIIGPSDRADEATQKMKSLLATKMHRMSCSIEEKHMLEYLSSPRADQKLIELEERHKVIIEKNTSILRPPLVTDDGNEPQRQSVCSTFIYKNKLKVHVVLGSILHCSGVDAVVSPSNPQLRHSAGLARSIVDIGKSNFFVSCFTKMLSALTYW